MKSEVITARKNLMAGREQECNLPIYLKGLAGAYYRMANFNLAMQYTTFAERMADEGESMEPLEKEMAEILGKMLKEYANNALTPQDWEDGLKKLLTLREDLIAKMQAMTAFTDRLYLHEYVLRRIAPGREDSVEEIDSAAATNELVSFLFGEERKDSLRENISYLISELPVRMTRQKFMEWVRQTSAVFKEADAEGIERSFYMLYSAAGMQSPKEMEEFPKLQNELEFFERLNYREMEDSVYVEAKSRLLAVTEQLNNESDVLCSLMEIINSMTSLYLTAPFVSTEEEKSVDCCRKALNLALSENPVSDEEYEEVFLAFEGAPEQLEEELLREENYFAELHPDEKLMEASMQTVFYTRVLYAKKLHTTSLFVSLKEETLSLSFEEELEKFCEGLSKLLENGQKEINRARMAQVLYHLPVPFTKSSQVQKYILEAFENCHDMAEKTAALREIREYMSGNN